MKLLRLRDVGPGPGTGIFRGSVLRNLLGLVLALGMLGGLVALYVLTDDFPLFIAIPVGLLLALMSFPAFKVFVRSLATADTPGLERLAKALAAERNAEASSMLVHCPVSLSGNLPGVERRSPCSRVTPSARRALRELSRHVNVDGEG